MPEDAMILAALERIGGRLDAMQNHVASEFTSLRHELSKAQLSAGERLQGLETDRQRWFQTTWPAAQEVLGALADRVASVERSVVTAVAVESLSERLEKALERVGFLEAWRMKLVGLAAGVGLCSSVITYLFLQVLGK